MALVTAGEASCAGDSSWDAPPAPSPVLVASSCLRFFFLPGLPAGMPPTLGSVSFFAEPGLTGMFAKQPSALWQC